MVLQSTVHTVGGVITAGDAIMMIVPQADDLQVEAKVNPQDIDKLQIGQKTLLRLSAFNQRTTQELNGVVTRVSPDVHYRAAHRANPITRSGSRCRRKRSLVSATSR